VRTRCLPCLLFPVSKQASVTTPLDQRNAAVERGMVRNSQYELRARGGDRREPPPTSTAEAQEEAEQAFPDRQLCATWLPYDPTDANSCPILVCDRDMFLREEEGKRGNFAAVVAAAWAQLGSAQQRAELAEAGFFKIQLVDEDGKPGTAANNVGGLLDELEKMLRSQGEHVHEGLSRNVYERGFRSDRMVIEHCGLPEETDEERSQRKKKEQKLGKQTTTKAAKAAGGRGYLFDLAEEKHEFAIPQKSAVRLSHDQKKLWEAQPDALGRKLFQDVITQPPQHVLLYYIGPAKDLRKAARYCISSNFDMDGLPEIPGVSDVYFYITREKWTGTTMHIEDYCMFSANELLFGAGPKVWLNISPRERAKFEQKCVGKKLACSQAVRHRARFVSPAQLDHWRIKYRTVAQMPGEIVVTLPGCYHEVLNDGANMAVAVNFHVDLDGFVSERDERPCTEKCGCPAADRPRHTLDPGGDTRRFKDMVEKRVMMGQLPRRVRWEVGWGRGPKHQDEDAAASSAPSTPAIRRKRKRTASRAGLAAREGQPGEGRGGTDTQRPPPGYDSALDWLRQRVRNHETSPRCPPLPLSHPSLGAAIADNAEALYHKCLAGRLVKLYMAKEYHLFSKVGSAQLKRATKGRATLKIAKRGVKQEFWRAIGLVVTEEEDKGHKGVAGKFERWNTEGKKLGASLDWRWEDRWMLALADLKGVTRDDVERWMASWQEQEDMCKLKEGAVQLVSAVEEGRAFSAADLEAAVG